MARRNGTYGRSQHESDRFHDEVDRFSSWVDRAIAQAGPAPFDGLRIVPCNGGFELQEASLMTSGKWEPTRVAWSRDRKDMVGAARLRGVTLA